MPIFHDYDAAATRAARDCAARHGTPQPGRDDGRAGNGPPESFQASFDVAFASESRGAASSAIDGRQSPLDRVTLIERLKRSQSPSWPAQQDQSDVAREDRPRSRTKSRHGSKSPLPPAPPSSDAADASSGQDQEQVPDVMAAGLSIERPRSALHSGDFRQEKDVVNYDAVARNPNLSTSPVAPWHHSFPAAALPRSRGGDQSQPDFSFAETRQSRMMLRSRTTSHSCLSSSFVLLPPTSPLVQQSNNTDLDFTPMPSSRQAQSPERDNRRHTFSPQSLQTYHTSIAAANANFPARPLPSMRREGSFPYQAHQPRRSLTSFLGPHSSSTPQSPLIKPRRPSISSESSPLQHAPMVGSYEESILRGRMSTTPSRPLNFIAQIGVLGKGQCKSQLRCPPHVTLPFPAVFYSYNSGNGRIADDQPSPYVGLLDIENNLKPAEEPDEKRRRRRRAHSTQHSDNEEQDHDGADPQHKAAHRKREKMKRRSTSPKSPSGGSYRIPQQGQLQIVIKNPNKTAVKLFLVPYDLGDMEPGQKTFIRQRSYSAGPIIDMPLSSRANFGTDRPEASLSTSDDPKDRPILRYLIHLHICCPSKGRFFLYKSIRVVFANRVPDGKEKLRNEIQLPDPRYSAYKLMRENNTPAHQSSHMAALSGSEKAFKRRSAGFSLVHGQARYDRLDGLDFGRHQSQRDDEFGGYHTSYAGPAQPIAPIPFSLSSRHLEPVESRPGSRDQMDMDAPPQAKNSDDGFHVYVVSPTRGNSGAWDKRAKGSFSPPPGVGAGLLAQRLRGLDVVHKKGTNGSDA